MLLFAAGVWAGTTSERYFGGIDPGPIVLDEVVGMLITLAFIPVDLTAALIGFVLFRIFDVVKPFPARRLEALHGGLGVMADDAMAAIYANIALRLVLYFGAGWLWPDAASRVSTMNSTRGRTLRTAEIIAVGSELLGTTRLDTNSLYITERLSGIGIEVRSKSVVGDDRDLIAQLCRQALDRVDLVILTGGLGPTDDDLTRDAVASVTGRRQIEQPAIVERLAARFARRGLQMPDINRRQALLIDGAVMIDNPNGTAPGQYLDLDGQLIVLLPGPPRELQPMLNALCEGVLERQVAATERVYRTSLFVTGRTRVARRGSGSAALRGVAPGDPANRDDDSRDAGTDRTAPLAAERRSRGRGGASARSAGGCRRRPWRRRLRHRRPLAWRKSSGACCGSVAGRSQRPNRARAVCSCRGSPTSRGAPTMSPGARCSTAMS